MSGATFEDDLRGHVSRDQRPAGPASTGAGRPAEHRVTELQRTAGNAAVVQLIAGSGHAGHDHDHEDEPAATAQRSPVLDVVGRGGGAPLPTEVRQRMEGSFGADFGDVRVHTDGAADDSARSVGAHAYTVGSDVVFRSGAYDPGSETGQHTIAHELTHVVQQRSGPVAGTPTGSGIAVSDPSDRFEREAESTANAVMSGGGADTATGPTSPAGPAVQRQEAAGEDEEVQTMVQREEAPEEEDGAPA